MNDDNEKLRLSSLTGVDRGAALAAKAASAARDELHPSIVPPLPRPDRRTAAAILAHALIMKEGGDQTPASAAQTYRAVYAELEKGG